jgi:DNA-binding winged helix-turn-helix (wHTH) protein/tetratricopeptide (TPR) repeat protein
MGNHYQFGDFALDLRARELRRGAALLTVSPKVFDCIAYLIEHRERAVGRDELIAAVWGRADVADVQLSYLMRKVRRLLDDDSENEGMIRTIPRYGFRWIAELQLDPPVAPHMSDRALTDPKRAVAVDRSTNARTRFRTFAAWTLVASAMLALLVLWWDRTKSPDSQASPAPPTAVLPATGDVDGDAEWMRFGLMDAIASRLRAAGIAVASSADIVALSRDEVAGESQVERVRSAIGARNVVLPTVTSQEHDWSVRLEIRSIGSPPHVVEGRAPDPILAARDAADRMLDRLGLALPANQTASSDPTTELIQRVEAAMLVSDYDRAQKLIEAAPQTLRDVSAVQLQLGRIETATGHSDEAHARLLQLLGRVSASDDVVLRARVLSAIGVTELDQPKIAVARISEAIALLDGSSEPAYLGAAYNNRGIANKNLGRYDEATADYASARTAYSLANDTLGLASIDNNEAAMDIERGRIADALIPLQRASQRFERIGALSELLGAQINLISLDLALLQPLDALEVFERARYKFDRVGDISDLSFWKAQGAATLVANGRLREAAALLDEVLQQKDPAPKTIVLALALALAADVDFASENFEAAANHGRQALAAMPDPPRLFDEHAKVRVTLIRSLRKLQQTSEADSELARLMAWAEAQPQLKSKSEWYARLAAAEQAFARGQHDVAERLYREALERVIENDTATGIVEVTTSFGNALIDAGDLSQASLVVGRVGRWAEHDYGCALLSARLYHALGKEDAWRSALDVARRLAGERTIPLSFDQAPRSAAQGTSH